jgi:hypothetical protein
MHPDRGAVMILLFRESDIWRDVKAARPATCAKYEQSKTETDSRPRRLDRRGWRAACYLLKGAMMSCASVLIIAFRFFPPMCFRVLSFPTTVAGLNAIIPHRSRRSDIQFDL